MQTAQDAMPQGEMESLKPTSTIFLRVNLEDATASPLLIAQLQTDSANAALPQQGSILLLPIAQASLMPHLNLALACRLELRIMS
jgi:hypothetical protein